MTEPTKENPELVEKENAEKAELEALKKRADVMGISYAKNATLKTLKKLVEEALNPPEETKQVDTDKLTLTQKKALKRKEAMRLHRVRITCMNPNKSAYQGDLFVFANSFVGTVKVYIPFGVEWHVPEVILKMIENKKFQQFRTKKVNGHDITEGYLVREYSIDRLPPLTPKELEALEREQKMRNNTD